MDLLVNGEVDLYEFLEVDPSAPVDVIKRQYRRIALLYHPDKNKLPLASEKFQLLSAAYEVLSNPSTRSDYDRLRSYKIEKRNRDNALDEYTKRLKEELLKAENSIKVYDNLTRELDENKQLEKLREQGLKRRKMMHSEKVSGPSSYISYRDLPIQRVVDVKLGASGNSCLVVVKWKHRPELEGKFALETLKDIMEVFGEIQAIFPTSSDDKYNAAVVEYKNAASAENATKYNYKSASKWDGTPYRKLASLLRGCESHTNLQLTSNETVNAILTKM